MNWNYYKLYFFEILDSLRFFFKLRKSRIEYIHIYTNPIYIWIYFSATQRRANQLFFFHFFVNYLFVSEKKIAIYRILCVPICFCRLSSFEQHTWPILWVAAIAVAMQRATRRWATGRDVSPRSFSRSWRPTTISRAPRTIPSPRPPTRRTETSLTTIQIQTPRCAPNGWTTVPECRDSESTGKREWSADSR